MSQDREASDLEEEVAELRANIDGLTNELVDAKERIRELEVELGLREGSKDDVDEDKTVEELFEAADTDPTPDSNGDSAGDGSRNDGDESDHETIGDDIIVG
ncbi:MAG: hypothetical protein ABEJ58_01250 [Halodesulfurarchaeum sp.]